MGEESTIEKIQAAAQNHTFNKYLFRLQTTLLALTMGQSVSKKETTFDVSQRDSRNTESDSRCPHGFDSCEYYVRRYCCLDGSTTMGWKKGDPEDDVILKIDALEREMRTVEYLSRTWEKVCRRHSKYLQSLRSKLKARLDKPGRMKPSFVSIGERLIVVVVIDSNRLYVLVEERREWERVHGIDVQWSTSYVSRSQVIRS